jgi:indolepyruvate ferredoxin oxidoreductase
MPTQTLTPRLETTLDDKYTLREGWAFMSGMQALVRLPIQQRMRDEAAGKNTAGFVSGYRGSPIGRYDIELWRNGKLLDRHHVRFQPGVNEDLAATAAWGAQYVGVFPGARYDGVFAIWYGKCPGVDRSGDALRHANLAGTSPWGGVVALAGDDHAAKSSTAAAQSDQDFIAVGIPLLYPSSVQEILDYGLHGIAMSRHSGCWTGLKLVTDVVESSGTVFVGPDSPRIVIPPPPTAPGGLSVRRDDTAVLQEERLYNHKLYAALAYARENGLNRTVIDAPSPRLGIVAAGKSYADVRQALLELGLDEAGAAAAGIRLLKIGMVWPLDPEVVTRFAEGLETILVVEEKRPVLEDQLKTILYDAPLARRPRVIGKFDGSNVWSRDRGAPVLPVHYELSPPLVAATVARLLGRGAEALATAAGAEARPGPIRMPNFCSGCPHNTSTQVPAGSRAMAGIGCHAIARLQRPEHTSTICHMGAEGVMWVGQAPFTDEKHVFANLGDGTYFHSGFLAIRQAVAARVPITYKLLVNGFVSMTGGQPIDGELSIPQMAAELLAEGVRKVVVVTDEPERYRSVRLPPGVPVHHRRELERVQRQLREEPGVTVLMYDQMCATERRRQRKRGKLEDPQQRIYIHADVCEGCGDCSAKSNCMSVEPLETELGRKRRINQSTCNKDYSCVEGFCPSFVTLVGARPVRGAARALSTEGLPPLPEATPPALGSTPYGVLVTGIGGTGVVTIGSILGVAAHVDGKAASVLDVTGLAQKYGAVMSHVRIAADPALLQSTRLAAGEADLVVGCDLVVTAGSETLSRMDPRRTRAVVNTELTPTSDFTRNPDWRLDVDDLQERVRGAASAADCAAVTRIATALMGDAIAVNVFMVGYAWQKGWLPITRAAIERAIELNDVAVPFNQDCFQWGRRYAQDPASVEAMLRATHVVELPAAPLEKLEDVVAHRSAFLAAYQDEAYAQRYRAMVDRVARREREAGGDGRLALAVARHHFKLLAHKDEFEVARLYAAPEFRAGLARSFEGDYRLRFHLGAGPFARKDPVTAQPRKTEVGAWILVAFRVLAALRFLRGTWLDPFRRTPERKLAARLLADYERDLDRLGSELDRSRQELAVAIASWPEHVRGYAHVRAESAARTQVETAELWRRWDAGGVQRERAVTASSA